MAVTFSGKQQINCRRGADTQHDGAKDPSGRVLRNASTGDAAGETHGRENRDCLPFNGGHDDEDDKAQTRHRKEHDSERTPEFYVCRALTRCAVHRLLSEPVLAGVDRRLANTGALGRRIAACWHARSASLARDELG